MESGVSIRVGLLWFLFSLYILEQIYLYKLLIIIFDMVLSGCLSHAFADSGQDTPNLYVSESHSRLRVIAMAEKILEECEGLGKWYCDEAEPILESANS